MWNIREYVFNNTDALNAIDLLGLEVIGSTCTDEQREKIASGMQQMCAKALSPALGCCNFSPSVKNNLQRICNPKFQILVMCVGESDMQCPQGMCAAVNARADFKEYGVIYFCPRTWREKEPCGSTLGCVVLHELLHGAGAGMNDPNTSIQMIEKRKILGSHLNIQRMAGLCFIPLT
jgi:hypothetical protein